jgi:GNAT superfamily N-acetyltransferase
MATSERRSDDPVDEKELIADQLRRGVPATEVMRGVRARSAARTSAPATGELVEAQEALVDFAARMLEREAGDLRVEVNSDSMLSFGKARRRPVRIENLDAAGQPMTTGQAIASLAREESGDAIHAAVADLVAETIDELRVAEVPYEVVAEWKGQAARDHVALGPTRNTTWYAAFRGSVIVGVAGLIRVGKLVRVKGVYVPRGLRGEGIGTFLTEAVIAAAPAECDVEVLAYNPAFYAGRGFDTQGEFRKGVTRLIFARPRST